MPYVIDRAALDAFLTRQVDLIESAPIPAEVAALITPDGMGDGLTLDELHGVWLGAGLAAQIGLVLTDEPGRFITVASLHVPVAA